MQKLRYGVIGIKKVGRHHIRSARENEEVVLTALVDNNVALVNKKSEEFGVRGFTDYREMLEAGIVDAVSIATPHHLHGIMGLDCLKAGVHIYVEKPFTNRVSEADAMIAVAKVKNLKICVGYQYRTYHAPQTMKHLIDTGAIGKIMRVLWTWGEFRPESYYARDIWRGTFQDAGGGVLMNQVSHDLDLICWMVGKPVQVSALIGNQLHQADTEDVACANVLFGNGACGSLQFTTSQPKSGNIHQIAGEKGIIVVEDARSRTSNQIVLGAYEDSLPKMATKLTGIADQPEISWQSFRPPGTQSILKKLINPKLVLQRIGLLKKRKRITGYSVLMDSFIDAIINGGEPMVSGESARSAVELINAIILSAMRKKMVDLPIDPKEYDQLFEELSHGKTRVPRFR